MAQSETLTAAQVIAAVMQDVQAVAKKERNAQQGFNFRGIDAVVNAVGPALRKHGGFIVPLVLNADYEQVASRNGGSLNVCRLTVSYEVHGPAGDALAGSVFAEAFDSGDKATAKAMSVAYRTFLLQLLCLPTDDPDPDSFSYEVEVPKWDEDVAKLKTRSEARDFWMRAKRGHAPADVLAAVEQLAAELPE